MKVTRRRLRTIAVLAVAGALIVVLALIAAGILVLPSTGPPAPVTVTQVCVTVLEGTNSTGYGWFGPSSYCLSGVADHYPYQQAAGSQVTMYLPTLNYNNVNETLYSVSVASPFTLVSTLPPLPYVVAPISVNPEGIDGGLAVMVLLPSTAGATLTMYVTVNALSP